MRSARSNLAKAPSKAPTNERVDPNRVRLLARRFFARPSHQVAPDLLGKLLVVGECVGRVTEVEAYGGADDAASHAFRGPTSRNQVMFQQAGLLYVYFTYGMHHCMNVVTGQVGGGEAVLLRAVEPVAGVDVMFERRGRRPLADGPGKLCQAFGVDLADNSADCCSRSSRVRLYDDATPPPTNPVVGPRIGISREVERLWRWRLPSASTQNGLPVETARRESDRHVARPRSE